MYTSIVENCEIFDHNQICLRASVCPRLHSPQILNRARGSEHCNLPVRRWCRRRLASAPSGVEHNARRFQENAAWRGPYLRRAGNVFYRSSVKLLHLVIPPSAPNRACARMQLFHCTGNARALAQHGKASSSENANSGAAQGTSF